MMEVPLHGKVAAGRVALVDDEDFELVSQYRWYARQKRGSGTTYAWCNVNWRTGEQIHMHQLITGQLGMDHADGDGLNNQKCNLRTATKGQNSGNQDKRRTYAGKPVASRYKGVRHYGRSKLNPWQALCAGKYIGVFPSEEDAAKAYDQAAMERWGEFAKLNFPLISMPYLKSGDPFPQ